MGVKQQRRRERHEDKENAEEEGGYNVEEEGGGYNDNKERHARSRKVGDRYNDEDHEPSTHSQVPRHIQYTLYYL